MGRSVSYPSGSIVAFTVLEVEDSDDWEFEYEWLRDDLRQRAALSPSGSPNGTMDPIGMPIGAPPVRPGRSAGSSRLHPASMRYSAPMTASGTCRMVKASTANGLPDLPRDGQHDMVSSRS